jgi:DUF3048 family protein
MLGKARAGLTVAVAIALLAACSGSGDKKTKPASTARPRATVAPVVTEPPPILYALTGLPVDDATRLRRPALVVKIDNAPKARPQAGLEAADVVYEEVVEGGVTRFLAVFQSNDAPVLGPVRSVRPIDPAIVTPLGGLFAYSGGAPKFQAMIRRAPVHDVGFDAFPGGYRRERGRPAPNNLFTSTGALWGRANGEPPPPSLFAYLTGGQRFGVTNQGMPIGGMVINLGERTTADWAWDAGAHLWRRSTNFTPHLLANGEQLGVVNVVLQFTGYRSTGDLDVGGNHVPEADIVGTGMVIVLADGKLVRGRWSKPTPEAITQYLDNSGAPIRLVPGRTWVQFTPSGAYHAAR